jgi:hypothetical protein
MAQRAAIRGDLFSDPLDDAAGLALKNPITGSAPETLDCSYESSGRAALVTVRRRFRSSARINRAPFFVAH